MLLVCVVVVSRSPSRSVRSQSVFGVVVVAEPPCARPWVGRTVVRGSIAPSVVNSVKVRGRSGQEHVHHTFIGSSCCTEPGFLC